jgi:hypothetical protein
MSDEAKPPNLKTSLNRKPSNLLIREATRQRRVIRLLAFLISRLLHGFHGFPDIRQYRDAHAFRHHLGDQRTHRRVIVQPGNHLSCTILLTCGLVQHRMRPDEAKAG